MVRPAPPVQIGPGAAAHGRAQRRTGEAGRGRGDQAGASGLGGVGAARLRCRLTDCRWLVLYVVACCPPLHRPPVSGAHAFVDARRAA
jgi:hypothetical protein